MTISAFEHIGMGTSTLFILHIYLTYLLIYIYIYYYDVLSADIWMTILTFEETGMGPTTSAVCRRDMNGHVHL